MHSNKINKLKIIIPLFIILSVTFLSFLPTLRNGFVNWDDEDFVIENDLVKDLSWQNITRIFTQPYQDHYKPLVFLTFAAEYRFFKNNPFYYHLINLLFHLANSLLVFWFILLLTKKRGVSFLTALLFGIHPLRVESVAWVFQLKDMLCGFFFLWALILYLYYRDSKAIRYYCLALVSFALSLISKPMGIALPFVLLAIDYVRDRRIYYLDKVFFLCVSIGVTVFNMLFNKVSVNIEPKSLKLFSLIPYQISFYLDKVFFPLKLSCLYPGDILHSQYLRLSPLLLTFLTLAVLLSLKYTRKLFFASLFFMLLLAPALFSLAYQQEAAYVVADHFTYLALIGLFYILAEGFFWIYRQKKFTAATIKIPLILAFSFIVVTLSFMTYQRTRVWKNSITLWSDCLENYPDVATAHNSRGVELMKNKEYDKAYADFIITLDLDPTYYEAYLNLGSIYNSLGDYKKAIDFANKSLQINPEFSKAYYLLIILYGKTGAHSQVIDTCKKLIKIEPNSVQAYINLSGAYGNLGNFREAIAYGEKAVGINPKEPLAQLNLSAAYYYTKQYDLAIKHCDEAVKLGYKVPDKFLSSLSKYRK